MPWTVRDSLTFWKRVIDVFRDPPGYDYTEREINVPHTIPLPYGHVPPYGPRFRHTPQEREELEKQVAEGIAKGIIEPSSAPYGSLSSLSRRKMGHLECALIIVLLTE
jgi:hypothetical protein